MNKEVCLYDNLFQKTPEIVSIISTFKCTAACTNCCFECSPERAEELSLEEGKRHIEHIAKNCPTVKVIVITGGEAFINFKKTIELIKEIKKYGFVSRVVTNAFWAKNRKRAKELIRQCISAGLDEINLSTGDDHLAYVPLKCIHNAITTTLEAGLTTVVNIESGKGRKFTEDLLLDGLDKDLDKSKLRVTKGLWMPFTKEQLGDLPTIKKDSYPAIMERCTNLFTGITISPNNHLLACCGLPVKYIPQLNLGNLYDHSISELYRLQFNDFLKIWLFIEGPYKILSYLEERMNKEIPELRVLSHICFYCACLMTNPEYLNAARLYYKDKYESVMLKFFIQIKMLES